MKKRGVKKYLYGVFCVLVLIVILLNFSNAWVADRGNDNYEVLTSTYNATLINNTGVLEFRDLQGNYLFETDSIIFTNGTKIYRKDLNVVSVTLENGTDVSSLIIFQNATEFNFTTNYTFYKSTGLVKVNSTIDWNVNTTLDIGKVILDSNLTNKKIVEDDGSSNEPYAYLVDANDQMLKTFNVTKSIKNGCSVELYVKWYDSAEEHFNTSISMWINDAVEYNLYPEIVNLTEYVNYWISKDISCSDLNSGLNNITFNYSNKVGNDVFYLGADDSVDYNRSASNDGTGWNYSDLDLRTGSNIFDGEYMVRLVIDGHFNGWNSTFFDISSLGFSESPVVSKYSPSIAKLNLSKTVPGDYSNLSIAIYGDRFGAENIEEINESSNELEIYFYNNKSHEWHTFVHFDNGTHAGSQMTFWADKRYVGDRDSMSFIMEFKKEIPSLWVSKARFPRAYDAAFTVVEDADSSNTNTIKAVYYGTNDTSSDDYGNKGFVGHNLKMTPSIWTTNCGGGCHLEDSDCKILYDDLYSKGFGLSLHTTCDDTENKTQIEERIQTFKDLYSLYDWIEHYSGCSNPATTNFENSDCYGNIESNTTYYITDILEDAGIKYYSPARILNGAYNVFTETVSLPRYTSYLNHRGNSVQMYIYKRSATQGKYREQDFEQAAIDKLIADKGLHLNYNHFGPSNFEWYHPGNYTINGSSENNLAYMESKQNSGDLWVAPVYKIFDFMIGLQKVDIISQNVSGSDVNLTIVNKGNSIKGVTLELNNNVSYAKEKSLYLIYVNENKVVLSNFSYSDSKDIEVKTSTSYDNSIPRLSFVDVDMDVLNATYDSNQEKIYLSVENSSIGGKQTNNTLTIQNFNSSTSFFAMDNGEVFFSLEDANSEYDNNLYIVSYNSSSGEFNFTLPSMSVHNIVIQSKKSDSETCSSAYECSGGYCNSNVCASSAPSTENNNTESPGGGTIISPSYTVKEEKLQEGQTRQLRKGHKVTLKFANQGSKVLEVISINEDKVVVKISSFEVEIVNGTTEKIDVNDDGFYDLEVSLEDISESGSARLMFKEIYEEIESEEEEAVEEEVKEDVVVEENELVEPKIGKWWIYPIIGVVVLILFWFIFGKSFFKSRNKN